MQRVWSKTWLASVAIASQNTDCWQCAQRPPFQKDSWKGQCAVANDVSVADMSRAVGIDWWMIRCVTPVTTMSLAALLVDNRTNEQLQNAFRQ